MGMLYYRKGLAATAYNNFQELYHQSYNPNNNWGSIQRNYDYAQLLVKIENAWFDYDKCENDGSDIAFYYKDEYGAFQLATSYKYYWLKYGISLFILKLPNAKYNVNFDLAMEYGKDYTPPTGVVRSTGQTTNLEDVVEMFDDFDSLDPTKWQDTGSCSIGGSKVTLTSSIWDDYIGNPRFYTKKKYDNIAYQFYFKGKFTYACINEVVDDPPWQHTLNYRTPTGIYFDIDEDAIGRIEGRYLGSGGSFKYKELWKYSGGEAWYTKVKTFFPGIHTCIADTRYYPNYVNWYGDIAYGSYYCGGTDSNGVEKLYSWGMFPFCESTYRKMWCPHTHYQHLGIDAGFPIPGGGLIGYLDVQDRESSFGFCGTSDAPTEIDWCMIMTNQYFWAGVQWEPETVPTLVIEEPVGNICSLIPNIKIAAKDWLDASDVNLDVTIQTADPYAEVCIEFLNKLMLPDYATGATGADWEYKMQEFDDFLARGDFKILATAVNRFGFAMSTEELFLIENCYADYNFTELIRDFPNFEGTVKYNLENPTEERVNIKNFLQSINKNNSLIPINILEADTKYKNNYLLGLKTTPIQQENYEYKFGFAQDEIYDALNKKEVFVDCRIVVYNYDDAEWDVSAYVKEHSFDRDADLGAVQLSVTLDLTEVLSPFSSVAEPYSFYGNKIVVYHRLKKVDGTIYEERKFTGQIREASATKVAVHLVAHDKFVNFQRKTHEDIHYSPDKIFVDEYLTTFDGTKFRSSQSSWTEYPPPRIFLGEKQLRPGEYAVDYPRGMVYVFRNTLISGDVIKRIYEVDDFPDRRIFDLGFNIDYSSAPIVEHIWEEKIEDYKCVGGLAGDPVWIEQYDQLFPDEYYIDYENNKLILYVAIPADNNTQRNHKIIVSAREIMKVSAKYYYQVEETNEVEDIIYDLAQRVGFDVEELEDTVTETIYKGDGNFIYTVKNNIKAVNLIEINGRGVDIGDWEYNDPDNNKLGQIEFKEATNINIIEAPLDAIVSLQHVSASNSGIGLTLDNADFYYADASIKAEGMNILDFVEVDYDRHFFYKSCGKYGKIGVYVKVDKWCAVQLEVDDAVRGTISSAITYLAANTWTPVMIYANGIAIDQIEKMRVKIAQEDDIELHVDYFHIGEDDIQVTYTYYTMQNTGITVSEAWWLKEEIDAYIDVLDDLLEQVEPSYLVYVDKDGKLRGEYTKVSSYVLRGQVIKRVFVDVEDFAGYFHLPDFYMKLMRTASTSLSDEDIYTAVLVLGKLADKNNVCLFAEAEDKCTWAPGKAYGINKKGTLDDFIKYVPPDIPAVLIKKLQDGAPDTYEGMALVDGDVWSGVSYYKTSKDGNAGNATINSYMIKVTLREPILFEEIAICIGAYQNKKIREEIYIELEDESGSKWYPSGEFPNKQNGNTSTWLRWENNFNKNRKIKYIHIYCSQPHHWVTSTQVSNSKKIFVLPLLLLFPELLKFFGIIILSGFLIYITKKFLAWKSSRNNRNIRSMEI